MKILEKGLTRRGLLKRLGLAAVVLPVVKLGQTVADKEEQRRKRNEKRDISDIWIGHC